MYGLLECQYTAAVVAGKLQCDNADSNREQQHGKNVVYKENHDRNCRTAYKYHQQQTKQKKHDHNSQTSSKLRPQQLAGRCCGSGGGLRAVQPKRPLSAHRKPYVVVVGGGGTDI